MIKLLLLASFWYGVAHDADINLQRTEAAGILILVACIVDDFLKK